MTLSDVMIYGVAGAVAITVFCELIITAFESYREAWRDEVKEMSEYIEELEDRLDEEHREF